MDVSKRPIRSLWKPVEKWLKKRTKCGLKWSGMLEIDRSGRAKVVQVGDLTPKVVKVKGFVGPNA
ncbi:ABC-type transporter Mla MlaB component [Granulicella aggregans]|uniref:ABC-type transporter Mla MlaB component n=1 Tax=Granulicella aggregans TaxID=474949 RepID=A0A7W7ZDZ6_9BACT|nr:ABC-type transporter Mla MlaB component [Granulicella aggregans]